VDTLVQGLAVVGLLVGLVGVVAPGIPGPALVWLSMLVWSWADGFHQVGWPTLLLLAALAAAAELADFAIGAAGAKRAGIATRSLVVAGIAAVVGLVAFQIIGAVVAGLAGLLVMETRRLGHWRHGVRSGGIVITAYVVGMVVQILLVILMTGLFAAKIALS
jgi:uncharacterized protein YqgC (DUF456 family)